MVIKVVAKPINISELKEIAAGQFGDMVKAVVDVRKKNMAIGGELHADEEALLLEQGANQEDLWGINIYPDKIMNEWIEYDSLINIRPSQNNRSRDVENAELKAAIAMVVKELISP